MIVFSIMSAIWSIGAFFTGVGFIWRMPTQYNLILGYADISTPNWLTWLYFYPAYAFWCAINCIIIIAIIVMIVKRIMKTPAIQKVEKGTWTSVGK
jgi:magnesium-transporting ATPase (P-type)